MQRGSWVRWDGCLKQLRFRDAQKQFLEGELLVKVYPWEYVKFLCKKSKALRLSNENNLADQALRSAVEIAQGLDVGMDTEVWQSIEDAKVFSVNNGH